MSFETLKRPRYNLGLESGFYSHKPEVGRQITLFEIERCGRCAATTT